MSTSQSLDALLKHAINCHDKGLLPDAEAAYRKIIAADGEHTHAHYLLGALLGPLGRYDEALKYLDTAIDLDPGLADAYLDRANVHGAQSRHDEAIGGYRRAIELEPDNHLAHGNLGSLYRKLGRWELAAASLREATGLEPGAAEYHFALGAVLIELGELDQAIIAYEKGLELQPDFVEAQNNLGALLKARGRISESISCFRRAAELNPTLAVGHGNLGTALMEGCRLEAAEEQLRTAVALDPANASAYSNLLLCLNYHPDLNPVQVFEEHGRYGESQETRLARASPSFSSDASADRRLRVAYVSPDFRTHSVARFIAPVLAAHDRQAFEIFCLANVPQSDDVTRRLKGMVAAGWHDVSSMTDERTAELVRELQIDILIDLAGHSASNRLGVFARKPAPVQMTYLGYPATTGLSAVDYRLTDTVADPIGETESYYCERLLRLPDCFLCYEPPQASPPCKTLPAASAGHVTFGSFNNACKINPGVISAWSRILRAVPESRLVLKATQFADHELRLSFHRQFALHGILADRIDLHGWLESHATHLERYQEIDVGLDPFPYNGTTTTCESLWMGVPVVTLSGKAHAARVGTSILTAIGLAELIAHSVGDYVDRAVGLARDLTRLKALRRDLRTVLESSPLTDANQFTRNLEQAYRSAWREWCEASTAMRASKPDVLPASGDDAVVNYGLSANAASDRVLRLHIGGEQPRPGWQIFNVVPGPDVDYVGNCTDLSQFGAGSVDEVYASHVLEHIGYQEELPAALHEIHRVLKPGGVFALSVPDLDILCRLFLDPRFPEESQFQLMRLMYGGQTNDYDFHKVGLTWTFIRRYLGDAGFREIKRVEELGIFDDTSSDRVEGQPISLNVVAKKSRFA